MRRENFMKKIILSKFSNSKEKSKPTIYYLKWFIELSIIFIFKYSFNHLNFIDSLSQKFGLTDSTIYLIYDEIIVLK